VFSSPVSSPVSSPRPRQRNYVCVGNFESFSEAPDEFFDRSLALEAAEDQADVSDYEDIYLPSEFIHRDGQAPTPVRDPS
jgi:hypothetical protein